MNKQNKVHLQFPYKMAFNLNSSQRFLLTTGHIFLALNGLFIFIETLPLAGIFLAIIFFSIASIKKDVFTKEAVKFSFRRLILAILFIIILYLISVETGKQAQDLWLTLIFIQLPLSINDALHIYRGKLGVTIL